MRRPSADSNKGSRPHPSGWGGFTWRQWHSGTLVSMKEPERTLSSKELRRDLSATLQTVHGGQPIVITVSGYQVAVLVSVEDWRRLAALKDELA